MTGSMITIVLPLAAIYVAFLLWYRGSGRPLTREEIDGYLGELRAVATDHPGGVRLEDVERLLEHDDGREFIMQNLIRYREKALYPPGHDYGDSARAADRRYGKAILPHLLRYGNVPVFVARRAGRFVEQAGMERWDVVAMVRYRSRRDFLRFAVAIERGGTTVHKWAAIENTQIFPVRPLLSLIFVRGAVGVLLAAIGLLLAYAFIR
jgi:hypothetical protein